MMYLYIYMYPIRTLLDHIGNHIVSLLFFFLLPSHLRAAVILSSLFVVFFFFCKREKMLWDKVQTGKSTITVVRKGKNKKKKAKNVSRLIVGRI